MVGNDLPTRTQADEDEMMTLAEEIEVAEAKLARLRRVEAGAPCREVGHDWSFSGGCACTCEHPDCSFSVYECTKCGDCDYGDNAEAVTIREQCERLS